MMLTAEFLPGFLEIRKKRKKRIRREEELDEG